MNGVIVLLDEGQIDAIARRVVERLRAELGAIGAKEALLTKDELSLALRVTPQTLDSWARKGMPFEDRGTYRLYDREACESWARGRRKPGRPPLRPASTSTLPEGVELRARRATGKG